MRLINHVKSLEPNTFTHVAYTICTAHTHNHSEHIIYIFVKFNQLFCRLKFFPHPHMHTHTHSCTCHDGKAIWNLIALRYSGFNMLHGVYRWRWFFWAFVHAITCRCWNCYYDYLCYRSIALRRTFLLCMRATCSACKRTTLCMWNVTSLISN